MCLKNTTLERKENQKSKLPQKSWCSSLIKIKICQKKGQKKVLWEKKLTVNSARVNCQQLKPELQIRNAYKFTDILLCQKSFGMKLGNIPAVTHVKLPKERSLVCSPNSSMQKEAIVL